MTEELCAKLHDCLRSHGIDPYKVRCGAYCGDGWVRLIDELIIKLISLNWDKKIEQIKEKFGYLRFSIGCLENMDEDQIELIYNTIYEAEDKSRFICEYCGNPGEIIRKGWLQTLCPECAKTEKLKYNQTVPDNICSECGKLNCEK